MQLTGKRTQVTHPHPSEMPGLVCDNPPASGWLACAYKKVFIRSLKHCAWHSCRAMTLWESCMGTCRTRFPWDLSVAQTTNCAYEGVVMPVCSNSSRCPGICVAHKSGSTTFKLAMHKEFARRGTRLRYCSGCRNVPPNTRCYLQQYGCVI